MEQIDFKLTKHNLMNLVQRLKSLDKEQIWTVKEIPYQSNRTLSQNDYYWKIVRMMAEYFGLKSEDEMHELLAYKFLRQEKQIKNLKITAITSTTKLNKVEFNNYLEKVKGFAEHYGFHVEDDNV